MTEPRAQGRHAGLTRDDVVRAAARLADQDGAAALSMRKVARELGVEAMTLYHYVPSKQALEDAVVEHVVSTLVRTPDPTAPWAQVLADFAQELHGTLRDHPGAVPFFATRPAVTERTLAELDGLLRILHAAGFAPRTALLMVYAVSGAVIVQHLAPAASDLAPDDLRTGTSDGSDVLAEAFAEGPVTADARLEFTVAALVAGFDALRDEPAG